MTFDGFKKVVDLAKLALDSVVVVSDVRARRKEEKRKAEDDKKDRESLAKLYDERNLRTLGAIDTLTRQQKLLEYEMQRLREDVTKKNGSSR